MSSRADRTRHKIAARIADELRAQRDREPFVDEIAERYIGEQVAAAADGAAMQMVADMMAVVERLDLSDLVAQIETDPSGNPLMRTPEQRHAQALWSAVNELTDRATTWQRIFTPAAASEV